MGRWTSSNLTQLVAPVDRLVNDYLDPMFAYRETRMPRKDVQVASHNQLELEQKLWDSA